MKIIILALLVFMTSCQTLPQLYQSIEEIADYEVVEISIAKDAFQNQKDVHVTIDITNSPIPK